jgi:hypothetical protein
MDHSTKKSIKAFYDHFWESYKEELGTSLKVDLAVSLSKNASVILDAGCGKGSLVRLLASIFPEKYTVGIDISAKACKIVHRNVQNSNTEFIVADLAYLPLRNCSFDLTIFSEVIEHIFVQERKAVIRELRRLVKPSGRLLLTTPHCLHPIILLRKILNRISRGKIQLSDQPYDYPLSPRSLITLLRKTGWEIQSLYLDKYTTGTRIKIRLPRFSIFAIQISIVAYPKVFACALDMFDEYPKVVAIVLTWNSKKDIIECLRSLKRLKYPNYEIIVVDNASTDGTPKALKSNFSDITLIRNKQNLGFGGGFNVGINEAIRRKADYVACLNSDIILDEHFLMELVKAGELNEKIGGLCPIAYYYDQPNRINGAGGTVRIIHSKVFGCGKLDKGQYSKVEETGMLCGPALVLKMKALLNVGFLDTDYFYGPEDMDIALRLMRCGYKIIFVPGAKLWHKGRGATGGKITPLTVYFSIRNHLLFAKKHAGKLELVIFRMYFWLFFLPFTLLRFLIFGKKNHIDAAIKGVLKCVNPQLHLQDNYMVRKLLGCQ